MTFPTNRFTRTYEGNNTLVLNQGEWYINGVAVTATAAQLNTSGGASPFNGIQAYVSQLIGNDLTGNGSQSFPFATIAKAYATVASTTVPVVIIGMDGAYYDEQIVVDNEFINFDFPFAFLTYTGVGDAITYNNCGYNYVKFYVIQCASGNAFTCNATSGGIGLYALAFAEGNIVNNGTAEILINSVILNADITTVSSQINYTTLLRFGTDGPNVYGSTSTGTQGDWTIGGLLTAGGYAYPFGGSTTPGYVLTATGPNTFAPMPASGGGGFNGIQVFVSQQIGNDLNNGSYSAPFATLTAAQTLINGLSTPCTLIVLDNSIYSEQLNFTTGQAVNIYAPYAIIQFAGDALTLNNTGICFVQIGGLQATAGTALVVNSGGALCNIGEILGTTNAILATSSTVSINSAAIEGNLTQSSGTIFAVCAEFSGITSPSNVYLQTINSVNGSWSADNITSTNDINSSAGNITADTGNLQSIQGNIIAGSNGQAGQFISYPAGSNVGNLTTFGTANTADVVSSLTNQPTSFSIEYQLPLLAFRPITLLGTPLSQTDPNANIICYDIDVTAAQLMGGASVPITLTYYGGQYRIREMYINSNTTNFSGGDRDLSVNDGTTIYSLIPSSSLLALTNARWGSAIFPFPASAAINTLTQPAADLNVVYSGGTTDYLAGDISFTVMWEKVV